MKQSFIIALHKAELVETIASERAQPFTMKPGQPISFYKYFLSLGPCLPCLSTKADLRRIADG
jgi:hypothetical protein